MQLEYQYLGMTLRVPATDRIHLEYFAHCAAHAFHLQACRRDGLLRYPPSPGCPWCGSADCSWKAVEGRGTVYSYTEVAHAIQPGFAAHLPYLVLLVELDTQRGQPSEHESLRMVGNLVDATGALAGPDVVAKVGIGSRMRMVFTDVGDGMSLPQWTLDEAADAPAPATIWRYPGPLSG